MVALVLPQTKNVTSRGELVSPCIWGAKDDDVGEKAINFKTLDYVGHEGRFRIAEAFNFAEHVACSSLDYRYVRLFCRFPWDILDYFFGLNLMVFFDSVSVLSNFGENKK